MPLDHLDFDLTRLWEALVRLTIALVLALPIGWERERRTRSAGLRTFPLVAAASCGYTLIAVQLPGDAADAHSRVLQGLLTGIGFIGGGAILKSEHQVRGTATAAGIWVTGAIGAAAGYGHIEIALLLSLIALVVLRGLGAVEQRILRGHERDESDKS
jgi:putative Mg2+ transporter-C (MgtC) family protein